MRTTASVPAAAQTVFGVDSYLVVFGGIAAITAVALLLLLARRHLRNGLRLPLSRTEDLFVLMCALSAGVTVLHELVTDRVCHGACR